MVLTSVQIALFPQTKRLREAWQEIAAPRHFYGTSWQRKIDAVSGTF